MAANGTGATHPNGQPIVGHLKRPAEERAADYKSLIEDDVEPSDTLGRILKSLLTQYLIKQEHRIGWAMRSACDDKVLHPHPNESVAAHQWGVAYLVVVLSRTQQFKEELPGFDALKALEMALLHDVPEAKVGDITPRCGISPEVKHELEREAFSEMFGPMPESLNKDMHSIYEMYEERQCAESKFVKDCDKLDFILTSFLLERQGFTGFSEFYTNSVKEGFSTKLAEDFAEAITKKRAKLLEKNMLFV